MAKDKTTTGKVTGKPVKGWQIKVCRHCGNGFDCYRKDTKYCSKACKQAAYRARQTTPLERAIAKRERYRKMLATKASTIIKTTCCGCGCEMYVTALQGRGTLYHNRACKQRAYRERKAYRRDILSD